MEIPPTPRPVLKSSLMKTTIIILILELIIAYTVFQAYGGITAPGARSSPGASQNGKVRISDRGGSVSDPRIFEHNVYFPIRDEAKLFPKLRPAWICRLQDGKQNNIWQNG
jgi:hypothetical protein